MKYLAAVLHPWACLVFLLPLLIVYEGGVLYFGQQGTTGLRGGADEWFRVALSHYGLGQAWIAPLVVVAVFVLRSAWSWKSRPTEPLAVGFGMLLESIALAGLLWAVAKNFGPLLQEFGVPLASIQFQTPGAELVKYVGAGIYEEVLFRLGLYTGLVYLFRLVLLPSLFASLIAAVLSSLVFAAAHRGGGDFPAAQFLFLTFAGLYFTTVYVTRGFGIAVGCHAAYDILAGVSVG